MRKPEAIILLLILAINFELPASSLKPQTSNPLSTEVLTTGLHYQLPKSQTIKLRVTKIPKKFPWVERNLDGEVELAEVGSTIIAENIDPITISDPYDGEITIQAGAKFYAEITGGKKAKSFWRKGEVQLEFNKLELKQGPSIDISDIDFDSSKNSNIFLSGISNVSKTAVTGVAGAIAAPLLVFSISSIAGVAMMSNPMIAGATAAVGGGAGVVYGIKRKGKSFILEPGTELELELKEPWLISDALGKASYPMISETLDKKKSLFDLNIIKVRKSKDDFGDKAIKISLKYNNKTNEELRYNSFQLVDSMGKEYQASSKSFDDEIWGKLPKKGKLDLYFTSEFPDTTHHLEVVRYIDRKTIASEKIVLR